MLNNAISNCGWYVSKSENRRGTYVVDVMDSLWRAVVRGADLDVCLHHVGRLGDQGGQHAGHHPTAKVHQRDIHCAVPV